MPYNYSNISLCLLLVFCDPNFPFSPFVDSAARAALFSSIRRCSLHLLLHPRLVKCHKFTVHSIPLCAASPAPPVRSPERVFPAAPFDVHNFACVQCSLCCCCCCCYWAASAVAVVVVEPRCRFIRILSVPVMFAVSFHANINCQRYKFCNNIA